MRAFAGGYYSNLKALYDHLDVQYHSQPFLFEFAEAQAAPTRRKGSGGSSSYFIHASNLHKIPPPRPSALGTISYLIEIVYLLACYTWFSICCFLVAPREAGYARLSETLGQYVKRIRLPEYFVAYYLLPLISGVTTCPHEALLDFPASDLIEYKRKTHGAPHYTVSNGVGDVQERLAKGIDYELRATISKVEPLEKGVRLSWIDESEGSKREEVFDRVVIAVAPDIVGRIFEPLRRHMARIPTTLVESVVHTDRSTFGDDRVHEPSNNNEHQAQLICLQTLTDDARQTESIHVQNCGAIVTTCPFSPIDPSLTICSAKFTRVLRSAESRSIVNSIFGNTPDTFGNEKTRSLWRNGDDNVWLAGGWCWDGMVLLEGCVVSATRVARDFDVDVPWLRYK
jgi:hypothetical protein